MDKDIENFTLIQKDTFTKVKNLKEEIEKSVDPTTFVLNPKIAKLQKQLEEEQEKCDHIWKDGVCIVCGRVKD